jgi:hypothetical protein
MGTFQVTQAGAPYSQVTIRLPYFGGSSADGSGCALVVLTGTEYVAIQNKLSATSTSPPVGSDPVNVTPDIFVGCMLVMAFALGWISGGQR